MINAIILQYSVFYNSFVPLYMQGPYLRAIVIYISRKRLDRLIPSFMPTASLVFYFFARIKTQSYIVDSSVTSLSVVALVSEGNGR